MATLATSFRWIGSERSQAPSASAELYRRVGNQAETKLQLQYRLDSLRRLKFSYGERNHSPAPAATAFERVVDAFVWLGLQFEYVRGSLDIAVVHYDTVVEVETIGSDFSWSLTRDAVVVHDHSHLYDELRYWDGSEWKRREEFTKPSCRLIRFRARHNSAGTVGDRHKFSYNVLFSPPSSEPIEYEIDPDIQNPKV